MPQFGLSNFNKMGHLCSNCGKSIRNVSVMKKHILVCSNSRNIFSVIFAVKHSWQIQDCLFININISAIDVPISPKIILISSFTSIIIMERGGA